MKSTPSLRIIPVDASTTAMVGDCLQPGALVDKTKFARVRWILTIPTLSA